jgi:hypothetical protein
VDLGEVTPTYCYGWRLTPHGFEQLTNHVLDYALIGVTW